MLSVKYDSNEARDERGRWTADGGVGGREHADVHKLPFAGDVMPQGKHAGKTLAEVYDRDPGYVAWLADRKFVGRDLRTDPSTHAHAFLRSIPPDQVGGFRLDFGKHAGRTLKDVGRLDPGYLRWMAHDPEIGRSVKGALAATYLGSHALDRLANAGASREDVAGHLQRLKDASFHSNYPQQTRAGVSKDIENQADRQLSQMNRPPMQSAPKEDIEQAQLDATHARSIGTSKDRLDEIHRNGESLHNFWGETRGDVPRVGRTFQSPISNKVYTTTGLEGSFRAYGKNFYNRDGYTHIMRARSATPQEEKDFRDNQTRLVADRNRRQAIDKERNDIRARGTRPGSGDAPENQIDLPPGDDLLDNRHLHEGGHFFRIPRDKSAIWYVEPHFGPHDDWKVNNSKEGAAWKVPYAPDREKLLREYDAASRADRLAGVNRKFNPDVSNEDRNAQGEWASGGGTSAPSSEGDHAAADDKESTSSKPALSSHEEARARHESIGRQVVEHAFRKAVETEPEITRFMHYIADSAGAELTGLKNRLKTADSIVRKVRDEIAPANPGADHHEIGDKIKDMVRYTVMAPEGHGYAEVAQNVINHLRDATGDHGRVKNFWGKDSDPNNPYKGINSFWKMPNGVRFEVQIHTPTSVGLKSNIHHEYEIYRDPAKSVQERETALYNMLDKSKGLPDYPGIKDVG